jgi:catalase
MSVKFLLADGSQTDIVANLAEGCFGRTPQDLFAFLQAHLPDPATGKPNPDAPLRFLERHPVAKEYVERSMQKAIPASYAQVIYYGVHAFRFTAADGSSCFGRYRWNPQAGEAFLTPQEGGQRDANFLLAELTSRLASGPAVFHLKLQIAQTGDPTDDATALWPADRRIVELGRLQIDAQSPSSADDERRLIFDPSNLTDGIEMSADPILRSRAIAYSISFERRSKGL